MRKDLLWIIVAIAFITSMSSCAVGRKMSFENKQAGPAYTPTKTATIVFQDKREDVLSGKEKASFCGHTNSTVQISYNIQTQSGRPLADEFAESVSTSYNNTGYIANALPVNMNALADSVIGAFKSGNKDRLLYFTIHKWESRATPLFSTIRYEVIYHLELKVYGKNGELLATCATQNVVEKKEGAATSMKKMQEMADDVFREQVNALFANESVKKSI